MTRRIWLCCSAGPRGEGTDADPAEAATGVPRHRSRARDLGHPWRERGPLDKSAVDEVLVAVRALPEVTARPGKLQRRAIAGAEIIINWLATQPRAWQERWERANPDDTLDWSPRSTVETHARLPRPG